VSTYVGIRPVAYYVYRGQIERGAATARNPRPGYRWYDGYSQTSPTGAVEYPWMTYRECLAHAKSRGKVARFDRTRARVQK
jgi:hypothetical protein